MSSINRNDDYYYESIFSVDGVYKYYIIAKDNNEIVSNSNINYFYVGENGISYNISFNPGWNLISLPVEYSLMSSELASSINNCLSVNQWDEIYQTYRPYIVGGPPDFDFSITPGIGLFIDTENSDSISFAGSPPYTYSVNLKIGWNLIGWYNIVNTMASSLSENITGCISVNAWDSESQTYKPYIVGGPPDFDFIVTPGMGLFVDVNEDSIWNGEG